MRSYRSPLLPAVEFGPDDVRENREGRLSPRQGSVVAAARRARGAQAASGARWLLLWFVVLLAVGVAIELARDGDRASSAARTGTIAGGVALALLALLGLSLVAGRWLARDLRHGRVSRVEGVADVLVAQAHARGVPYWRYELRLRRGRRIVRTFRLPDERSARRFVHGQAYRVYFVDVPGLPILLSAEELPV